MGKLDGKAALVLGGSRGIGRGISGVLAAEGAEVWALARDAAGLDSLKERWIGPPKGLQCVHALQADAASSLPS